MAQQAQQNCLRLITQSALLQLGTLTTDQHPFVSVAPFASPTTDETPLQWAIFISQLSAHCDQLRAMAAKNQPASLLWRDDMPEQPFATTRAQLQCNIAVCDRTSDTGSYWLEQLKQKYGDVVDMLITLPDFQLFVFTPIRGQFVQGFGQAFNITFDHQQSLQMTHIHPGKTQRPSTPAQS